MQRRLRSVSASAQTQCHVPTGQQSFLWKNLFAKFIEKYSDDNSVFNLLWHGRDASEANDTNRLVCGHLLHLYLHCLQSSLSQYDVALVNFCFLFIWNFADVMFIVCFFLCFNCQWKACGLRTLIRCTASASLGKCPWWLQVVLMY